MLSGVSVAVAAQGTLASSGTFKVNMTRERSNLGCTSPTVVAMGPAPDGPVLIFKIQHHRASSKWIKIVLLVSHM